MEKKLSSPSSKVALRKHLSVQIFRRMSTCRTKQQHAPEWELPNKSRLGESPRIGIAGSGDIRGTSVLEIFRSLSP